MKDARQKYGVAQEEIIPLVMHVFENEFSEEDEKLLRQSLEPLGVELTIKTTPSYLYYATIASSDADIVATSWIGDFADPLAFLELFHGGSTMNDSGWKNKKFDELIKQYPQKEKEIKLILSYSIAAKIEKQYKIRNNNNYLYQDYNSTNMIYHVILIKMEQKKQIIYILF